MTKLHSKGERLQKVLAGAGVASRRQAEKLIAEGRVKIDGRIVTEPGSRVDPKSSRVEVDGQVLSLEAFVYYLLNKPPNVVTTLKDPEGRKSVGELTQTISQRVYPVGRLDYDAEGLLLLTNDGDLAHMLTHPKFGVTRTYDAKVRGVPPEASLDRLRGGVRLDDGPARPLSVDIVGRALRNTWVRVQVAEGRHHLIKRLFDSIGHPVQRLRRVNYGGLELGDLPLGAMRLLTRTEVALLRDAAQGASIDRPHASTTKGRHTKRRGRRGTNFPR